MKKIFKTIFIFLAILVVVGIISIFSLFSWYSYMTGEVYFNKITKQAVKANDTSKCDKLIQKLDDSPELKPRCYSQVIIQNKNLNACVEGNFICFQDYFEYYETNETKDQTLCKVIQNQTKRDFCYLVQNDFVRDIKLCSMIQSYAMQDSCYIKFVRINKDATICDIYISTLDGKDRCYRSVADFLYDRSWCEKIKDPTNKQYCINNAELYGY